MPRKWIFLILASIAAITILAACGGDDDSGDSNPGGITAEEAGERVTALLEADGCDIPFTYTKITAAGNNWNLVASIGLSGFNWTYDPVANTVVEASGKCSSSK